MNDAVNFPSQEQLDQQVHELVIKHLASELPAELDRIQESKTPSLSIIATKGTMDMAYPPFILASTAAALGWDVSIFFTFYGLGLLKDDIDAKVSPLGNPAMPMKMPFGPEWLKNIDLNIPNALMANIPGFENMATMMLQQTAKSKGIASVQELRDLCIEADVNMVGCRMTVDMFGFEMDDFIDDVDWVGAASYLPSAQKSDISLFI
ncbi:MAG: NADH-quinone oxidoreductase subunit F [Methylococcales bacterium]|jgi:peroxiredoxin family protein|nr:NADH-quinone oxidoreductase subunit F [Methylococcales bacterium]MBT7443986.1 NADH-quinone oxidoreductase subunit F [Methylococcales bacterium]